MIEENELAPTGVLLVNLGTPNGPDALSVGRYLLEFLNDPCVLQIPNPLRATLVAGIVSLRASKSAHAYKSIWTKDGSPLLVHSQNLASRLQTSLGNGFRVALAMRYGKPSIKSGLKALSNCRLIRVVSLFPQYSVATSQSVTQKVIETAQELHLVDRLRWIKPFFNHEAFVNPYARLIREKILPGHHLLLSFHGLPESQIKRTDPTGKHCLSSTACCESQGCPLEYCYRAQCLSTAQTIVKKAEISQKDASYSFQSRMGFFPWIGPYTEKLIDDFPRRGIKKLSVACPSFVADCLETLEEIGMRGKERFLAAGGESFQLIPALNAEPQWTEALTSMIAAKES